jgi:hypothetical protein
MKIKTTVYYDKDDISHKIYEEDLLGRPLSTEEYDNISLWDLQTAICHSGAGWCPFDIDNDWRFTREFYDLSVDELKQRLKEHEAIILHTAEPGFRNEFPLITHGPRKGMPNFKKEPVEHADRMYDVHFEDGIIAVEREIELHEDGTFEVVTI